MRPKVGDRVAVYSGTFYGASGVVICASGAMVWVKLGNGSHQLFAACDLEVIP